MDSFREQYEQAWQRPEGVFRSEWLQLPDERDAYDRYEQLAWQYHMATEIFDRRVCRGRRGCIAVPVDGRELAIVNGNAREVLLDISRENGIDPYGPEMVSLKKAIQRTARPFEIWYRDQCQRLEGSNERRTRGGGGLAASTPQIIRSGERFAVRDADWRQKVTLRLDAGEDSESR